MTTNSCASAQAKTYDDAPTLEDIRAQLDALDAEIEASPVALTTSAVVTSDDAGIAELGEWLKTEFGFDLDAKPANFVNAKTPERIQSEEALRLIRQGVACDEAGRRAAEFVRPLLVRGRASQLTSPSPLPGSTADRAQSAARKRGAAQDRREPSGRHSIDAEYHGVGWFKALAAISDRQVWRFDVLLSKSRQREAYDAAKLGTGTWLQRRARRELEKRLGYVPEMVFAIGIESAGGLNLHVHVVMAIDPTTIRKVEAALNAFSGRRRFKHKIKAKRVRVVGDVVYAVENALAAQSKGFIPGRTLIVSQSIKSAATAASRKSSKRQDTAPSATIEAEIPEDAASASASINIDLTSEHTSDCVKNVMDEQHPLIHQAVVVSQPESNRSANRTVYPSNSIRSAPERLGGRRDQTHAGPARAGRHGRPEDGARSLCEHVAEVDRGHGDVIVVPTAGFRQLIERERDRRAYNGVCQRIEQAAQIDALAAHVLTQDTKDMPDALTRVLERLERNEETRWRACLSGRPWLC